MEAVMMKEQPKQALLSPSNVNKWLFCTPSARLEEQFPIIAGDYAGEGSLAHKVAELRLKDRFYPSGQKNFTLELEKLRQDPLYREEMPEHAGTYINFIGHIAHSYPEAPYIAIKKRLDYSHIVPGGFSTVDCLIIGGDTLWVVDFKYGKGYAVSAFENPQVQLEALGALSVYGLLYDIRKIRMVICQPRLENISQWELAAAELEAWGQSIRPQALAAYMGRGEFKPGPWCHFCRAKALCRAYCDAQLALEGYGRRPAPSISNEEIGEILLRAQNFKKWLSELEEYALAECLSGLLIPGWKAVMGRSNRQFINVEEAFELLKEAGCTEEQLFEKKAATPAILEKVLGKKRFAQFLSGQVEMPPGKPILVPESDRREPLINCSSCS